MFGIISVKNSFKRHRRALSDSLVTRRAGPSPLKGMVPVWVLFITPTPNAGTGGFFFWYVLSFSLSFFFANFLFCSSPVTARLSPEGPPGPTTDGDGEDVRRGRKAVTTLTRPASPCPRGCTYRVAVAFAAARNTSPCPSRLHALRHRALAAAHTASPCPSRLHVPRRCAPRGCTQHVAVPFVAARSTSPRPSWQHAARRRALHGGTQHVAVPFAAARTASPCSFRRPTLCSGPDPHGFIYFNVK
jgi:hypothetical protein